MKKHYKHLVTVALLMTSCVPAAVMADSGAATGVNLSADAHLNLRVTIPRFLLFRVGSIGSVDTITFAPTDAEVGDGNPIAGTGGDAGVGGSGANVAVLSNGGAITITENNDGGSGGLGTGAGNISLSEITVTSSDTDLETPALSDSGGNSINVTVSNGNVTDRTAIWTYAYDNTTTPAAGNYNADITYTAANF